MSNGLKITHPQLVGYLAAGIAEKSISDDLDINYTEVIGLIDNAMCDLTDEIGNIAVSEISEPLLKNKLNNILPSETLDDVIKNAFSIIWMYSQDF